MRGLGAYCNVFAIESFMDELARAAQLDPAIFYFALPDRSTLIRAIALG